MNACILQANGGVARMICHSLLLFYVRMREKQLEWKGFSNIIPPANENHRVSSSLSRLFRSALCCFVIVTQQEVETRLYMQIRNPPPPPPPPLLLTHDHLSFVCDSSWREFCATRFFDNFGTNRMNLLSSREEGTSKKFNDTHARRRRVTIFRFLYIVYIWTA